MVDQQKLFSLWQKVFSLISSRDHGQRFSPSEIFDTLVASFDTFRAVFEPAQNLNPGFLEWYCAVLITITPGGLPPWFNIPATRMPEVPVSSSNVWDSSIETKSDFSSPLFNELNDLKGFISKENDLEQTRGVFYLRSATFIDKNM